MSISGQFLQHAVDWLLSRTWVDYAELYFVLMSVVGQHFIAQRRRTGFYFWFPGNVVAVVVYTSLGRYPTALLYLYFTYNCVTGNMKWRRLEQGHHAAALTAPAADSRG